MFIIQFRSVRRLSELHHDYTLSASENGAKKDPPLQEQLHKTKKKVSVTVVAACSRRRAMEEELKSEVDNILKLTMIRDGWFTSARFSSLLLMYKHAEEYEEAAHGVTNDTIAIG